jgi:hypothetical protein
MRAVVLSAIEVASTTSKSWVIVADGTMARPTFSGASGLGVGAP